MTQIDSTEFKSVTSINFADNAVGEISANDLRVQMDNIADSVSFVKTSNTIDPTSNDDGANTNGSGTFQVGDQWVNETSETTFICVDNSTTDAKWVTTGGGLNVTISNTPTVNELAYFSSTNEIEGIQSITYTPDQLSIGDDTKVSIGASDPLGDVLLQIGSDEIDIDNLLHLESNDQVVSMSMSDSIGSSMIINDEGILRFKVGGLPTTPGTDSTEMLNIDPGADSVTVSAADLFVNDNNVWHSGNQGTESGLDADLLDGKEGSYYLTASKMINVATYIPDAASHDEAFANAIADVPEGSNGTIYVPYIGTHYVLSDYVDLDGRQITWHVDEQAQFGGANGAWPLLNGPINTGRSISMRGFSNYNDTCNLTLLSGPGATGSREAGISGYTPNTVEAQAYSHERGRAGMYIGIGDGSDIEVPDATFTATSFTPLVPIDASLTAQIQIGMFVDVAGDMLSGVPLRYTSRITSVEKNEDGEAILVNVEQWYYATAIGSAASPGIPVGTNAVVINPHNKIWGININTYLRKTSGDKYGETSGSWIECGVLNQTGTDATNDFDANSHPLHFYGYDAANLADSTNKAGVAFICRGSSQGWWQGFRNIGADIGFHNDGTSGNDGNLGFVSSSGYVGNASYTDGHIDSDFLSRTKVGGVYENNFRVVGSLPMIELGRRNVATTPRIKFFADGTASDDDDAFNGSITQNNATMNIAATNIDLTASVVDVSGTLQRTNVLTTASGASYTLVIGDRDAIVTMDHTIANTLTIPAESTVDYAVGTEIKVIQVGAGITTIDVDTGVTLNNVVNGSGDLANAGDCVNLVKVASDTWWAVGDIGAVA